jgi:hypothetical protein
MRRTSGGSAAAWSKLRIPWGRHPSPSASDGIPNIGSDSSISAAAKDKKAQKVDGLQQELFPGKQHYGLRVLHRPSGPVSGDVVFIHGLTGNSYDTWVSRGGVYWPTQLLARDFPDARIMTFGYDADVTRLLGPVSQNNVRDHAANLIADLAAIRAQDGSVGVSAGIRFMDTSLK